MSIRHLISGLALSGAVAFAFAASADDDDSNHPPHQPPPEAYTACESKAAGDSCTVSIHDHTLSGTCRSHDNRLVCAPKHPHGPPPEAFTACEGKTSGAACTVTFHDQALDGTCHGPPGDDQGTEKLACRPNNMPEPPSR